jgi:next to BRCA1 gene 1 protein
VPIYEPLKDVCIRGPYSRAVHVGICCDGPLCASRSVQGYINGIRYKCAVCHDTDFCANCEASPANTHNKTHPLIKFKTPVRHVTVSTCGERGNGTAMPTMGDRYAPRSTSSRATETVSRQVSMNSVQTVVDVEPIEAAQPLAEKEPEVKEETEPEVDIKEEPKEESEEEPEVEAGSETKVELERSPAAEDLVANYVKDTVTDGTVLPPNHVFEQTWVLRNTGKVAWPAGCAVRFVGGDYMGHVDSNHPAGISELVSASESTRCYEALEPGKEYPFTVLLRTPSREGKVISYWRLTTEDGVKFGHRLWCDVTVQAPKAKEEVIAEKEPSPVPTTTSSQMIFPKLEKESPVSSIHEAAKAAPSEPSTAQEPEEEADDFDDCQEWDVSDDGFMTDEEYDILDASDEEYLEEQQKKLLKK